ncbi:MAG: hypothetical protein RLZZ360_338 [Candidatus Parcubacteria bacterium]|jgi:uncharacterized membrane protein YbaN (DUF454 family)
MKQYIYQRHWLRKTVGISLILLGVLGLILPVLPGILPLLAGFELIGMRLAVIDRLLAKRLPTPPVETEVPALV